MTTADVLEMKDLSGDVKEKNTAFSIMRICACFAIVLLHMVNIAEILHSDEISANTEMLSMAVVYLLMWAVPLFVMISGALLLDSKRDISLKRLYGRYVFRVAGALILFGILFRFFDMIMNQENVSISVLGDALYKILTGSSWAHLWYLYVLIGIYVLLPAYRMMAASCDRKTGWYIVAVFIVFLSLLPILGSAGISVAFHLQVAAIYPLYFLVGYLINNRIIVIGKKLSILLLVAGTAGTIALCIARYSGNISFLDNILGSYASPFVIMQSFGIFAGFIDLFSNKKNSKVIDLTDRHTFGIYLVHMIYLRLFLRYMNWNPYPIGGAAFFAFAVVVFLLSFGTVFVLRLIPGIKKFL